MNVEEFLFEGQAAKQARGMKARGSIIVKRSHHGDQDPRDLMDRVRDDLGVGLGIGLPAPKDRKMPQKGGLLAARRSAAVLPQVASPKPKAQPKVGKGLIGSASMPDLSRGLPQGPRPRGAPANFKARPESPETPERITVANAGFSPFEAPSLSIGSGAPALPPKRQAAPAGLRRQTEAANAAFGLGHHVRRHAALQPDQQGPAVVVTPFG